MFKRTFRLMNNAIRQRAIDEIWGSPDGYYCTIQEETRTLEQNDVQFPILRAISKQLDWQVNGEMVKMDEYEWKDVLTAAFHQEAVRLAAGVFGGVVMVGLHTSGFAKSEFSEWIEFIKWFAADRGVKV